METYCRPIKLCHTNANKMRHLLITEPKCQKADFTVVSIRESWHDRNLNFVFPIINVNFYDVTMKWNTRLKVHWQPLNVCLHPGLSHHQISYFILYCDIVIVIIGTRQILIMENKMKYEMLYIILIMISFTTNDRRRIVGSGVGREGRLYMA